MSSDVFNIVGTVLGVCGLAALALSAAYFVAAIVGWRGPYRNQRLVRCALSFAVFPVCMAINLSLLFFVLLPTMARENKQLIAEQREHSSVVHVGDQAPSVTLINTDGQEFSLDNLRGKVVLLNFFATWCGPCILELPHIQEIWNQHHQSSQFALIVIGREETTDTINEFRRKYGYTFPMAPDPERTAYALYAEERIPRTYLIGADGKICFASTGFDEEDLKKLKDEVVKQLGAVR